jgi:hypothetical protein
MDSNVINGVLRAMVPAAVAWIVASGWLSPDDAATVVGAGVTVLTVLAASVWSVKSNTKK